MGLVSQVFDETTLNTLTGHLAVGHCRYSTTGASHWANAQPTLGATATGTVALAHNGNLTNTAELKAMIMDRNGGQLSGEMKQGNTSDTALVTALLEGEEGKSLEETAMELLPKIKGGFCFVFMDEGTLYAARDTYGIRPLCLGRLERGWVVASEQSALATVGASFIREIEPGEFIAIDEDGVRSQRFAEPTPAGCVFEYVYLARPDAAIAGPLGLRVPRGDGPPAGPRKHPGSGHRHSGPGIRHPRGCRLCRGIRHPVRARLRQELLRGPHLHPALADPAPARHPAQAQRPGIRDPRQARGGGGRLDRPRQHPARHRPDAPRGRRRRACTSRSPPRRCKWPCFYGIDFASRAELIANGATIEEISQAIGADSLAYISEDGMIGATRQPRERLCTACFTGKYPIELPGADKLGKNLLERTDLGGLPAARPLPHRSPALRNRSRRHPAGISPDEDPAEKSGATGCDPGPDAEFEELLTDADRVPIHHDAPPSPLTRKSPYDFRLPGR